MTGAERRKGTRHKTEIAATVHEKGQMIPATIINISCRGISLISQKRIMPGSKVNITMSHTDKYAIGGTVQWAMLISGEGKFQYRTGIQANEVLDPEDILKNNSF